MEMHRVLDESKSTSKETLSLTLTGPPTVRSACLNVSWTVLLRGRGMIDPLGKISTIRIVFQSVPP